MTDFDAATAWTWIRTKGAPACIVVAGFGLGGCETAGNILSGPSASETPPVVVAQPVQPQYAARIALAPIIGAPDALGQQLRGQVVQAGQKNRIGILADRDGSADFGMRGYLVAARDRGAVKVSYIWDVTDPAGKRVNRITGEEVMPLAAGKDAWASVTPAVTQAIADRVASSLGTWAPSQPKAAPAVAGVGSAPNAGPGSGPGVGPGASLANAQPVPLPGTSAATTASLPPGGQTSTVVTGAPGDGNVALANALQQELTRQGVPLSGVASQGYRVEGKVGVGALKDGKQPIQIDWRVKDGKGAAVGTVTQKNSVPPGSLDGAWGKTAEAAAAAAAQGIIKLLPQQAAAARTTN